MAYKGSNSPIVTNITSGSGTWTINPQTKWVEAYVWGGGGGGASGRKGTTAASSGGGGGAGAQLIISRGPASAFSGGLSYTIGTGGAGGAAQTTNATDGINGTIGNNTLFGSIVALGGNFGQRGNNTSGFGGNLVAHAENLAISSTIGAGGGGAVASATPAAMSLGFSSGTVRPFSIPGGGGGGGGGDAGTPRSGAAGAGLVNTGGITVITPAAGGISTGTIDGTNAPPSSAAGFLVGGLGGGGGGGATGGATGGKGGNGSQPGGGGGGGGGGISSQADSGAGGSGGDGMIIIVEYF